MITNTTITLSGTPQEMQKANSILSIRKYLRTELDKYIIVIKQDREININRVKTIKGLIKKLKAQGA